MWFRNERYQEELWRISFNYLKDHLSPETVEKYGPPPPEPAEAQDKPAQEAQAQETEGDPATSGEGETRGEADPATDPPADPKEGTENAAADAEGST